MNTIAQTSDELLPPATVTGLPRFLSYMRYPVFSREWMTQRIKLFGLVGLLYYVMVAAEIGVALDDWLAAIICTIVLSLGNFLSLTLGPWLALRRTQVRTTIPKDRHIRSVLVMTAVVGSIIHALGYNLVNNYFHIRAGAKDLQVTVGLKWDSIGPHFPDLPDTKVNYAPRTGWGIFPLVVVAFGGNVLWCYFLSGGFALRRYKLDRLLSEQAQQSTKLRRLEQQKHEADQQLAILQAQIEPHFLFNTLASVRSLVTQDQSRAAAMIDGLANYLRVTLPKLRTPDSTSTLGEQLDICTSYLELMLLRMGDRFSFSVDVPQSLREATVPPLLLLPLVENAMTHGVESKPGSSTIQISARLAGPALRIEVRDDGVGLNPDQSGKEVGKGMGLANIRNQLNLRYGTQASLEVSSPVGGGTSAVLVIPSHVPS